MKFGAIVGGDVRPMPAVRTRAPIAGRSPGVTLGKLGLAKPGGRGATKSGGGGCEGVGPRAKPGDDTQGGGPGVARGAPGVSASTTAGVVP